MSKKYKKTRINRDNFKKINKVQTKNYQDYDFQQILFKEIEPKTQNQIKYIEAINNSDIVFCIGPAGTGKSFLACNMAAKFFVEGQVDNIILCRPVVEAGERLGYLPGNFEEKLSPYLRPLYDAFNSLLGSKAVNDLIKQNIIEVAPLAYMRGRTLKRAFIILDEAQNTTQEQMKMFLTRMGEGSHLIINGDITQSDIDNKNSGLIDAKERLKNIKEVVWIEMNKQDILRHPTVAKIVEAYENK